MAKKERKDNATDMLFVFKELMGKSIVTDITETEYEMSLTSIDIPEPIKWDVQPNKVILHDEDTGEEKECVYTGFRLSINGEIQHELEIKEI